MIGFCLPAGRYRLSRFPGEFALHRSGEEGKRSEAQRRRKARKPGGVHSCRQALGYIGAGSHRKREGTQKFTKSREDKIKTLLSLGELHRVDPRTVPRRKR